MNNVNPVEITVKQPRVFKRHYEFWLNEKQIGTLNYSGTWNNDAELKFNDQKWTLKLSGFWKKTMELTAAQSPYTKYQIPFKWSYKLTLPLNTRDNYLFTTKGFWKRSWVWLTGNNTVIEMKSNGWSLKNRGTIQLFQPPTNEMLLLAVLGWYQLVGYEAQSSEG